MTASRARAWGFVDQGPLEAVAAAARRYDEMGMTGVLVPQIYAPPWATLAAVAAVSPRLEVASGVALAFTRSPFETAMAALDLDRLSGGRFHLGLGTSVRPWNEQRFGVAYDRPLARLREALTVIRTLTTAESQKSLGRFEGEFYRLDLRGVPLPRPVRPSIPIWLGAMRRGAIELTAELADGLLGHPAWSVAWLTSEVKDAVEAGLERAGRTRDSFRIMAWLRVAMSDDAAQAVEDARPGIPMYASQPQYASYYAAQGFGDQAAELVRLAASGASPADLAAAVPPEMARAFVLAGTPSEVAAQIDELLPLVDDVCLTPPIGVPRERSAEYSARIDEYVRSRWA